MTQGNEFKGLISMLNRAKLVKTLNFEINNHTRFLTFGKENLLFKQTLAGVNLFPSKTYVINVNTDIRMGVVAQK
jgi:hypothetical protein